ncbi:AAA family ATPase [Salegentibacter maritimus]|uniref:AAA family ATPase n=1 Tax=Salegentibacter maritimus TaxID=2794347 RepID=UPI0018E423A4|nr:ATP-binding protein [Salegentibacter maritimus]MBI6115881.1 ATP-binding protein [Salegentibacter maritimus]
MILKFKQVHKSISRFNDVKLSDLTILTGYNGSGKSHLLESIKAGSSILDNIQYSEIVLFDYKTFFLENEAAFNNQQLNQEKQNAWQKFTHNSNPHIKANFVSNKSQLGADNYDKIIKIADGRPFLSLRKGDFIDESLFQMYKSYKQRMHNLFSNDRIKNTVESKGLKSLAYRITNTLDELTEDDFFDYFTPVVLKNDFLPSQIGKLFLDYWYKYQMFEYKRTRENKKYDSEKFRVEFEKIHGPRPWVLITEILKNFNSFHYSINNPEDILIEPYRTRTFSLTLKHKTKGISIPFANLSSGEKILFSLVLSIYKSVGDKIFPSALLLDEIDASLHPSQIQNLLNVVNEVFINQNNVKVIIATHSPTTIALAEEKNIYVVNRDGQNRIEKQTKQEALKILSEGFITLDEGLQIFDQFSKKELTIFTEGNNINFIEKAIEIFDPELSGSIDIVKNLKDRTGKNQLKTLFDFFTKMPHDNKVLFIYDCDVKTEYDSINETYAFTFEKNSANEKVKKGIENLFAEEHFREEFYPLKDKDDGGVQSSLDKPKFEEYILNNATKELFENFEPMVNEIKEILKK